MSDKELTKEASDTFEPLEITSVSEAKDIKLASEMQRGMGGRIVFGGYVSLEPPFSEYAYGDLTPTDLFFMGGEKPFEPSPLKRWIKRNRKEANVFSPEEYYDLTDEDMTCIRIYSSQDEDVTPEKFIQLLLSLTGVMHPFSFEIVGTAKKISLQIHCLEPSAKHLVGQLFSHFPECEFFESVDLFFEDTHLWDEHKHSEIVVHEYVLSNTHFFPLRVIPHFRLDPLSVVMGAFDELNEDEFGVLQVLFSPVKENWTENIILAAKDEFNPSKPSVRHPDLLASVKEKISSPLFATCITVAASNERIAGGIEGFLHQFKTPNQGLERFSLPKDPDTFPTKKDLIETMRVRASLRFGMLLNASELSSLIHLPSSSIHSEKLERITSKTRTCPDIAIGHELVLGDNLHRGKKKIVSLMPDHRTRHMYVIGATGTGKSTFLLNMIMSDIHAGNGGCVLDPHGELIDYDILPRIPEYRFDDVVLFDPSDEDYPVGFNILYAHSEQEKTIMASDLSSLFRRFSTSWGDQMDTVLSNAILAFLESSKGGTLRDMRRFLVDQDFREAFLDTVEDRDVVYFWRKEFPFLPGRPVGPVLTRLGTFLRSKIIRNIVSQKENKLDFRKIMDEGKIFLCKLPHGAIGETNAYILGTFLVSKLQQIVMTRQDTEEAQRRNFYLYVDEFHNFVTESMKSILAGTRKYHLGLILANQEIMQVLAKDREVASAVLSSPLTRVCFGLGDADARKLSEGFSHFDANDLQNLSQGETIVRMDKADFDFNMRTYPPPEIPDKDRVNDRVNTIRELSRKKYATKREDIEKELEKEREPETSTPQTEDDFWDED